MPENDPGVIAQYWEYAGLALGGFIAGVGALFGVKQRLQLEEPKKPSTESDHALIRALEKTVDALTKDVEHIRESRREEAQDLRDFMKRQENSTVEIFREIRSMNGSVQALEAQMNMVIKNNGSSR